MDRLYYRLATLVLAVALLLPCSVRAQIVNGDFEAGGTGWTVSVPPGWTGSFPPAGGNPNGFGQIMSPFGNSGGEGCLRQQFLCGEGAPASFCRITLDYLLHNVDASSLSGRVVVMIDNVQKFVSPPADDIGWTSISFSVPCGTHEIELCLQVDAGNNGWRAGFDNVKAFCETNVGVDNRTWGGVKALYLQP